MRAAALLLALAARAAVSAPSSDGDDPALSITWPYDGATVYARERTAALIEISLEYDLVVPSDPKAFAASHADARLCMELDGAAVAPCAELFAARVVLPPVALGAHTLRASLVGADGAVVAASAASRFRAAAADDPARGTAGAAAAAQHDPAWSWWWHGAAAPAAQAPGPWVSCAAAELVVAVGVKSAGAAFDARQALRQTWLAEAGPGACVRFAVGAVSNATLRGALGREQAAYGDLLLEDALPAADHYLNLVEKTKGLLAALADPSGAAPHALFYMVADDDVYVRPAALVEGLAGSAPRARFYAGQVWAEQFNHPIRPQRDASHRNYVPRAAWPLDALPPFAIGPHYLLSADCARFVAANAGALRGLGTLEDVSVAVWLLALQVHPEHTNEFSNARSVGCVENAVSTADLTFLGLRGIHANLKAGRPMCDGYRPRTWAKDPPGGLTAEDAAEMAREGRAGRAGG